MLVNALLAALVVASTAASPEATDAASGARPLSPAGPTGSVSPPVLGRLGVFDEPGPREAVAFIGPAARAGHVATVDILIALPAPKVDASGLEGLTLSYLLSRVSYDCAAGAKHPLSITAFDPANRPTSIATPARFKGWTPVTSTSGDLADTALPYACGERAPKAWVSGTDEALAYARRDPGEPKTASDQSPPTR